MKPVAIQETWKARLELGFTSTSQGPPEEGGHSTVLTRKRHQGPLVVQKALYPEGPAVCHAIIVHPPAGIAGGDVLEIDIDLGARSHAAVSTPSATRWYKANGRVARQTVRIALGEHARLDWLPQENLFFEASRAELSLEIAAHPSACAIGWDATMLGRQARGERFTTGELGFASHLCRGGESVWREQGRIMGGDGLLESPAGMAGLPITATLWALGAQCTAELAQRLAPALPWSEQLRAGSTALPGGIVLVRILGRHMEQVRALMEYLWATLRPLVLGTAAQPLRLWVS